MAKKACTSEYGERIEEADIKFPWYSPIVGWIMLL
jgi:hypothetical protein